MDNIDPRHTWSDEQLADAVKASTSWRGVMRELGLKATSAGTIRAVRRRVTELGLDSSHFRGQRRWSDAQLRSAVRIGTTWAEVLTVLGLSAEGGGTTRTIIKSHAMRLGLDLGHLESKTPDRPGPSALHPSLEHLREAAPSIASAWFTLCGRPVSFPVEPAVYDLLCEFPDGIKRIQVKTTTVSGADGWQVSVGHKRREQSRSRRCVPYELGEIDVFFILDGDLNMYVIPAVALAGAVRVPLRGYGNYIVGAANGLITPECQTPRLR